MKKNLTKIVAIATTATLALSLGACSGGIDENYVQGVDTTNHEILVGNTSSTSVGVVGAPFNWGIEASLWYFNKHTPYKDAEDNTYTVKLKHYDEGAGADSATAGINYTKALVEDDKVFALVGHYGTVTVSGTIDYLEEKGVPMVYAATGVSKLYNTEPNVMAVQPLYDTEGQSMVATAFADVTKGGLGATNLGVIYTTDDAGKGIFNGITIEAQLENKTITSYGVSSTSSDDYPAAVQAVKDCDVIIVAANQDPFADITNAIKTANLTNKKIYTSYVNASASVMEPLLSENYTIYAGAWMNIFNTKGATDLQTMTTILTEYATETNQLDKLVLYGANSFAWAGYVAGQVFCEGLTRLQGKDITWKSYIKAMEEAPVDVPMSTAVDYTNGQRIGIDSFAVTFYSPLTGGNGGFWRDLANLKDIRDGKTALYGQEA